MGPIFPSIHSVFVVLFLSNDIGRKFSISRNGFRIRGVPIGLMSDSGSVPGVTAEFQEALGGFRGSQGRFTGPLGVSVFFFGNRGPSGVMALSKGVKMV